jgi:plasmid replication initiation protein
MPDSDQCVTKEGEYGRDVPLVELHVNMSNALVRAAHSLTLVEKRVIAACIAQIDSTRIGWHPGFDQVTRVRLTALQFADTYGIDEKNAYFELQTACDHLFERYIRIMRNTHKGEKEIKFRWVSSATYHHGEGWVEISFTPEVTPHLTLLRKQYTSYKLAQASALRSSYSWRLLELLAQFRNQGKLVIGLQDFRHAMDVPGSYRFKDVRVRAIEPAVQELHKKDGMIVTWRAIKKGKAVASLEFTFKDDAQHRLALE